MGVGTGILAPSAVDARAKRERTAGVGSDLSGRRRLCFAPEFLDTIGGGGTPSRTSPTPQAGARPGIVVMGCLNRGPTRIRWRRTATLQHCRGPRPLRISEGQHGAGRHVTWASPSRGCFGLPTGAEALHSAPMQSLARPGIASRGYSRRRNSLRRAK